MAKWYIQMAIFMRECGSTGRRMAKERTITAMALFIKVISLMEKKMALESSLLPTKLRFRRFGTRHTFKGQARFFTIMATTLRGTTICLKSKAKVSMFVKIHSIMVALKKMRCKATRR